MPMVVTPELVASNTFNTSATVAVSSAVVVKAMAWLSKLVLFAATSAIVPVRLYVMVPFPLTASIAANSPCLTVTPPVMRTLMSATPDASLIALMPPCVIRFS